MKDWDDLVSTALFGTAKRGLPAEQLLDRAAVLTAYRRAGVQPRRDVAAGEPAPTEALPRVSPAAARRLEALLADRVGLLSEWLGLCADAGARVPEELLPELLERARVNRALAERLAPVAGQRGRWLAAQNPAWHQVFEHTGAGRTYASFVQRGRTNDALVQGSPGVDAWETGRQADRVEYLAALRSTDPGAARELLATAWDAEDPDDRVEFALVLADGLGPDDEPFLERALDDRRMQVRAVAELLLGRLPSSAYAARMRERLHACVELDGGRLEVRPPGLVDAAMQRDGVPAKPRAGSSEPAGDLRLRELIARTPLDVWLELTGRPAADVIRMDVEPHVDAVRQGWWQAAVRQADPVWAAALVQAWRPGDLRQPGDLLEVLEPAERRAITTRMLSKFPAEEAAVVWLAGCPGPWDVKLGRAALKAIGEVRKSRPYALSGVRAVLADRLPIQLVDELQALAEQRADPMTGTLSRVADDMRFRDEMAREFNQGVAQ